MEEIMKKTEKTIFEATEKVEFPQYCGGINVYLVFSEDIETSAETILPMHNMKIPKEFPKYSAAFTSYADSAFDVVIMYGPEIDPGIIAHESYHAIKWLFRRIGATEEDEEVFAYHLDYLVLKTNDFLKDIIKQQKNVEKPLDKTENL